MTKPIVKTIRVPLPQQAAFELFTQDIGKWWPSETFSVSANMSQTAKSVEMSFNKGGDIVETAQDGSTYVWGTITEFSAPNRVAFTWHPGKTPDRKTNVLVEFQNIGDETIVTLTHSGWEALGQEDQDSRKGYVNGWDLVLSRYAA